MAESTSAQRPLDQIADGEPIISFRDVHKSFGDKHILRGITLDFPRGRTTVVIGPVSYTHLTLPTILRV